MTTQITDSMAKGMQALAAMETHAARLSEVAARLLTAHADGLPELLAVRAQATQDGPQLGLQPQTPEDARLWARALNVDVVATIEDAGVDQILERVVAEFAVDGVAVRIGAVRWHSAAQWAELVAAEQAEQVAA